MTVLDAGLSGYRFKSQFWQHHPTLCWAQWLQVQIPVLVAPSLPVLDLVVAGSTPSPGSTVPPCAGLNGCRFKSQSWQHCPTLCWTWWLQVQILVLVAPSLPVLDLVVAGSNPSPCCTILSCAGLSGCRFRSQSWQQLSLPDLSLTSSLLSQGPAVTLCCCHCHWQCLVPQGRC